MNKGNQAIVTASAKGYRITNEGVVIGTSGKELKLQTKGDRLVFGVRMGKGEGRCVFLVMAHRFQAYKKFGDQIFREGVEVRHLDEDPLNNHWDNIAIGSRSDNKMDQPVEKRRRLAKHAASYLRKLTDDQVRDIRSRYASGEKQKDLRVEYDLAKGTISDIINRKQYADVQDEENPI